MSFLRSAKCATRFATKQKLQILDTVLAEYGTVCNIFIRHFWEHGLPSKNGLVKSIVDLPETWLSARLRKVAAREAIDMILAVRRRWKKRPEKAGMPLHRGNRMAVSSTIAELQSSKNSFDGWLHLQSIGNKLGIDIPVSFHKQFNSLARRGTRLNSYVITREYVQFCFELEAKGRPIGPALGIDTGIKSLCSMSNGQKLGTAVEQKIEAIKRCKHGSLRQKSLRRGMRQYMDEVARDVVKLQPGVVVVEDLRGISHGTKLKRRLSKNMRRSVGNWNMRYWHNRLQQRCEENRILFSTVPAAYTSTTCPVCSHSDRSNRVTQSVFQCQKCGHADDADLNAARNILARFNSPAYGRGCKVKLTQV